MQFEWDALKASANISKHDVSFEEAKEVFDDPLFVAFYDPDHSDGEQRFLVVGQTRKGRLLVTSYTEREDRIRIISARTATLAERNEYEEG